MNGEFNRNFDGPATVRNSNPILSSCPSFRHPLTPSPAAVTAAVTPSPSSSTYIMGPTPFPLDSGDRVGAAADDAQVSAQETRCDAAAEGRAEKETSRGSGRGRLPPTPAAPGAEQSGKILPGESLLLDSPTFLLDRSRELLGSTAAPYRLRTGCEWGFLPFRFWMNFRDFSRVSLVR